MIYLVTANAELFENDIYKTMSIEESLLLLDSCNVLQLDSETTGRDSRICDILCIQFGSKEKDFQLVVDCSTVNILKYKKILESKMLVGQNLKFDLQFLYNYGIVPTKIYDTMIVEQLLYLGFPPGSVGFSLHAIAERRLNINIDKTVRGEIIWRGLDSRVIEYSANDVKYLEDIMWSQIQDCKDKECMVGAKLECDFVPAISYLEWCGIKLDEDKWKTKMNNDAKNLSERKKALDSYMITKGFSEFYTINRQGDLFSGFNLDPVCNINWNSSSQVCKVFKKLGFNVTVEDKDTGADKESVLEKHLKGQKGIDDYFLKTYLDYQESSKLCSTYGQGHLNAVNPKTGRIHTVYRQLGTASGRMSCGSKQYNTDLAKLKKISPKECSYPNMQQLPSDGVTRSCFVSDKGNMFVSCDYSALELVKLSIH